MSNRSTVLCQIRFNLCSRSVSQSKSPFKSENPKKTVGKMDENGHFGPEKRRKYETKNDENGVRNGEMDGNGRSDRMTKMDENKAENREIEDPRNQ